MRLDPYGPARYPRLWKMYFFVTVALTILPPQTGFVDERTAVWFGAVVPFLFPLFGYVWQERIGPFLGWPLAYYFVLLLCMLSAVVIVLTAWAFNDAFFC